MHAIEQRLAAALRAAPRPYRMPPLPPDLAAARTSPPETALAYAIEAARAASEHGVPLPPEVRELFIGAMAELIAAAMAPQGGDAAFQALVLRTHDAQVDEHVRLAAQLTADRRALRSAVDAIAHPAKTRTRPAGTVREALGQLHATAGRAAWHELRDAIDALLALGTLVDEWLRGSLNALRTHPALARLERAGKLLELAAVRRYQALCEQRGPVAGSEAAAAQGRAGARAGEAAERATVAAFGAIAASLGECRVVRSLRMPPGFPGDATKAKDEWDVALLHGTHVVLLAEVKAAPAAATSDFSRLHRGLLRLAEATPHAVYAFASADGEVRIAGASLRRLQPPGRALPAHVIYCCTAPPETQPAMLAASARAVLLAEPACVAFAQHRAHGESPSPDMLEPVWDALATEPRLRAALYQYETARAVRESMLRPDDLASCVAARAGA